MRSVFRGLLTFAAAICAVFSYTAVPSIASEYELRPGDEISFSILALQELNATARIDKSGQLKLPLFGWVDASDITLRELEEELKATASTGNIFYIDRTDGGEFTVVVQPEEVYLTLLEVEPVFVYGDVDRAGSLKYAPNLDVRKVLALSGGIGRTREPLSAREERSLAVLEANYKKTSASYIAALIDLLKLRAQEPGSETDLTSEIEGLKLSDSAKTEIRKAVEKLFAAEQQAEAEEARYLEQAIENNWRRIEALREQLNKEQEGVEIDALRLERFNTSASGVNLNNQRATDAKRRLLLSSSGALETRAALANAEVRQADFVSRLDQMSSGKRVQTLKSLNSAKREVRRIEADLSGIAAQIKAVTNQEPEVPQRSPELTFEIHRKGDIMITGSALDLNTHVEPGDVVLFKIVRAEN